MYNQIVRNRESARLLSETSNINIYKGLLYPYFEFTQNRVSDPKGKM